MTQNVTAGPRAPLPHLPRVQQAALEVEREFREIDGAAFFVLARVVRRVLQNQMEFASPWLPPPHRRICVIDRERLLWLVARDELGIEASDVLPARVMLIARPVDAILEKMSRVELRRYYWRLLFHARIDLELETALSSERVPTAELRRRIAEIGQTQFDEIQATLMAEQMLRKPDDQRHVYAEFIAVFYEFRVFSPELLPLFFPSLTDLDATQRIIGSHCDADALLAATRPGDLPALVSAPAGILPATVGESWLASGPVRLAARSPKKFLALVRRADKLRERGNNVRAALVRRRAYDKAPLDLLTDAREKLLGEVELLVNRLQSALELTDDQARPWLAMCERLLPAARHGFWNANARLLYDLQQVCLDHERETYRIDLLGWLISRGGRPFKQPLRNQRVVMMSKHLRRAAQRIPAVVIDEGGRRELGDLLRAAADAAEQILRRQIEPLVAESLSAARFTPHSVVERVGFRKLTHELLDGIVERGFLTLGDLRDAVSRNQLKSPDLNSAREFFVGDPLLTADQILGGRLDGVYQRGPFYLRWMQRLSSLAFGIPYGRSLTKYLALPFGLSFLALMAVEEVVHVALRHLPAFDARSTDPIVEALADAESVAGPQSGHGYVVYSHVHMFWLGCIIFALIHCRPFREIVFRFGKITWKLARATLVDLPRLIASWPAVAWCLHSFPMLLLRRFVLMPALVTAIFWGTLPALGVYAPLNRWWGLGIFCASLAVLNSRLGRDTQELSREFLVRTLEGIRVHLVIGVYTFIVDGVRWLMDGLERLLYAVDEWLRFRSGESEVVLGVKAIIGVVWAFAHGVIRFCVTLLIEPQINPIKHFPVVTVSHKLVLGTLAIPLATVLETVYDKPTALTLAGLILTGIPGIFGFLAWELKENWKLYKANRSAELDPVQIGHHGESLRRLLVPGFHSGTIPRLFAKRRRAARLSGDDRQIDRQARFAEKLFEESKRLRYLVERELLALLNESQTFAGRQFTVERVELATNRIQIAVSQAETRNGPVVIQFCEQSGWIVASLCQTGWLSELPVANQQVFLTGLYGLYKRGATGLVREQIESQLTAVALPKTGSGADPVPSGEVHDPGFVVHPYDISAEGLVVWPYGHFESAIKYPLDDHPQTIPRPRSLARAAGLVPRSLSAFVFREHRSSWNDWQAYWEREQTDGTLARPLSPIVPLLMRTTIPLGVSNEIRSGE